MVRVQKDLFIFGGSDNQVLGGGNNFVYRLDLENMKWKTVDALGEAPLGRTLHSCCHVNNSFYIFGGRSTRVGKEEKDVRTRQCFNDLYSFNTNDCRWEKLDARGDVPSPRCGHTMVHDGADRFIVFGGLTSDTKYMNEVYELNLASLRWTRIECSGDQPAGRERHSAVWLNEQKQLLVYGGWVHGGASNQCYSLDMETKKWSKNQVAQLSEGRLNDTDTRRYGHTAHLINNSKQMIVFGGKNQFWHNLNSVLVYNVSSTAFTAPSSSPQLLTTINNKFSGNKLELVIDDVPSLSINQQSVSSPKAPNSPVLSPQVQQPVEKNVEEKQRIEENERLEMKKQQEENERLEKLRLLEIEQRQREKELQEEQQRIEKERLAKEKRDQEEKDRLAKEESDRQDRLAKEESDRKEKERLAKEESDRQERLKEEANEKERLAKEESDRQEKERLAKEESDRLEKERLEESARQEKLAKEESDRLEKERLAKEESDRQERQEESDRQEKERLAKQESDRVEKERLAKEESDRQEKEESERLERVAKEESDRLEKERLAKEESDRLEKERIEEADRQEKERLAKEESDRLEKERLESDRLEKERLAKEESDRQEKERLEKEESDRLEKERLAKEESDRQEKQAKEESDRLEKATSESISKESVPTIEESQLDDSLADKLKAVENKDKLVNLSKPKAKRTVRQTKRERSNIHDLTQILQQEAVVDLPSETKFEQLEQEAKKIKEEPVEDATPTSAKVPKGGVNPFAMGGMGRGGMGGMMAEMMQKRNQMKKEEEK